MAQTLYFPALKQRVLDQKVLQPTLYGDVDFTAQPYEAFIAVTLLYVLINVTVMFLMRHLEQKVRVPGLIGGK